MQLERAEGQETDKRVSLTHSDDCRYFRFYRSILDTFHDYFYTVEEEKSF